MADIKHVGRIKSTGRKCLVVFRTLPNDAFNCLVVLTENLSPSYHDALINLVESNAGQTAFEFAEVLNRNIFNDGTIMLHALHRQGLLTKLPTDAIEMTPNASSRILLADLNQLIAERENVSVQDLAVKEDRKNAEVQELAKIKDLMQPEEVVDPVEEQLNKVISETEHPLSDEDLAKKYRSDADRMSKEAARLRRMAEELVPTKKKQKETASE